jgi:riboflavin transporter FmnP
MRRLLLLLCALLGLPGVASAGTLLSLDVDNQVSSISVTGPPPDSRVLAGALTVELGALPPLAATTTFDLRALTLLAVGPSLLAFVLDPDLENPGAGVLNANGQFLIPTLFLQVDDGTSLTDLAVSNVTGSFTLEDPACLFQYAACLDTYFEMDGGATFGTIAVRVAATTTVIPEPSTALLVAFGVASLAVAARRSAR